MSVRTGMFPPPSVGPMAPGMPGMPGPMPPMSGAPNPFAPMPPMPLAGMPPPPPMGGMPPPPIKLLCLNLLARVLVLLLDRMLLVAVCLAIFWRVS
jgi:hypothetical protein